MAHTTPGGNYFRGGTSPLTEADVYRKEVVARVEAPRLVRARDARARLSGLDQPDRALADYDAALHLDPRSVQALYGRAVARRKRSDFERAAADFAAAGKISSKVAEEYTTLGVRP